MAALLFLWGFACVLGVAGISEVCFKQNSLCCKHSSAVDGVLESYAQRHSGAVTDLRCNLEM